MIARTYVKIRPDDELSFDSLAVEVGKIFDMILSGPDADQEVNIQINQHLHSDWISIDQICCYVDATSFCANLNAEVVQLHYIDEFILDFSYEHFSAGQLIRQIHLEEEPTTSERIWKINDGMKEPWESEVLDKDMDRLFEAIVRYFQLPYDVLTRKPKPILRTQTFKRARRSWFQAIWQLILRRSA